MQYKRMYVIIILKYSFFGEIMQKLIYRYAEQNGIDTVKIVNISSLHSEESRGYPYAILLVKALPKEYIQKLNDENKPNYEVFVNYENITDKFADKLATVIQNEGYNAISQSENGIDKRGEYDEKTKCSILPHKKIAIMSGMGWIGKNNLLITEKYGAALSLCSVLTDMPLAVQKTDINVTNKCGNCNLCVNICPVNAIYGKEWNIGVNRDDIINIYQCIACLKCLAGCRYSIGFSMS